MSKKLFLIRGLPGSGKTTFAESICENVFCNDDFHLDENGVYRWDGSKVKEAATYCQYQVETCMLSGEDIAVANTFTREKEMTPYFEMAEDHGYQVFTVIVENRHGNKSVHGVPDETMDKMKRRFVVQL